MATKCVIATFELLNLKNQIAKIITNRMKNRITILIIASIATLIALSAIQGYLIENAYQLEKKLFIQETDWTLFVKFIDMSL